MRWHKMKFHFFCHILCSFAIKVHGIVIGPLARDVYLFIPHCTCQKSPSRLSREGGREKKVVNDKSRRNESPSGARHSLNFATNRTQEAFRLSFKNQQREKFFIYLFFKRKNCLFAALR